MKILLLVGSYLLGSIPFGLLFSRMVGTDVRQEGSRNIGATNVSRVLGKKLGFLTLVCDAMKGLLPPTVAAFILSPPPDNELVIAACGLFAIIGHMFPVYLGFKGGKGVATSLGVFLFLSSWAVLFSAGILIVAVVLTGFVSVGSLAAAALLPLWLYLLGKSQIIVGAGTITALLIWIKHYENIRRLIKGEEKTWKKKA